MLRPVDVNRYKDKNIEQEPQPIYPYLRPFLTLTIVGRSRGDVSSHQDVFQTFGFPESQDGWFFEDFTLTSPLDLPTMVSVTNVIRDDV